MNAKSDVIHTHTHRRLVNGVSQDANSTQTLIELNDDQIAAQSTDLATGKEKSAWKLEAEPTDTDQ